MSILAHFDLTLMWVYNIFDVLVYGYLETVVKQAPGDTGLQSSNITDSVPVYVPQ